MAEREEKNLKAIIFDTETAGVRTQSLLNVGYKIVDIDIKDFSAHTLVARDYIMRDIYRNTMWMRNDMFVGDAKLANITNNIEHKGAILRTEKQTFEQLAKDIDRYGVEVGYAYNCQFDTDKFAKTALAYGLQNPLEKIKVFDIWGYAYWNICMTDEYREFCVANNLYTKSGRYIPTSVEGVTKFLNQDVDFVEEHTALSDVHWETRILLECAKRGQNLFEYITRGGWIKPNGEIAEIEERD